MRRGLIAMLALAASVGVVLGAFVVFDYLPSLKGSSDGAAPEGTTVHPVGTSFNLSGKLLGGSNYTGGVGYCGVAKQFQGSVPAHASGVLHVENPSSNTTVQTYLNFSGGGGTSGSVGFHGKADEQFTAPSDGAFVVTLQGCNPYSSWTAITVDVWLNYTNPAG